MRKINKGLILCLLLSVRIVCPAAALKTEVIEWTRMGSEIFYVKAHVEWRNAWRNSKNFDAAWLFLKFDSKNEFFTEDRSRHALIAPLGHRLLVNHIAGSPAPVFEVSDDQIGIFVYPSSTYRGDISWTVELALDRKILSDTKFIPGDNYLNLAGIEMVYIPEGSFTLGDPDSVSRKHYSFFRADAAGKPDGLYTVTSETTPVIIGKQKGNLCYNSASPGLHGDQKGTLDAFFPKGHHPFFIMKYETSQGEYSHFLNSIPNYATHQRANFSGKDYYRYRGSISLREGKYVAENPTRPCNYISWDDATAFADWAGLRPMTELEFEKSCRGPLTPISHEYPWNTPSKDQLLRYVNEENNLVWSNELKEGELNDANRDRYGASYFWVMDLSGSQWERCVTVGDSTGRAFRGTHGDGNLSDFGFATNADWPVGSSVTSGFGFRGGAYYEHNRTYGSFWPQCPIAYRDFAAWPGGGRVLSYSSRFVRTVSNQTDRMRPSTKGK